MRPHSLKFLIQEKNVTWFAWWTVCRDFTVSKVLKKYLGSPCKNQIIVFKNGDGNWATDLAAWHVYGKNLVDKIVKHKFPLSELVKDHKTYARRVNFLCKKIEKLDTDATPANKAVDLFRSVIKQYLLLNEAGFVPVVSDLEHGLFTAKLQEVLKAKVKNPDNLNKYLNLLMTNDQPNLPFRETTDLFKLAIKYPDAKKLAHSPELTKHTIKYCWVNFGYTGPAWKEKDFLDRISKLKKENPYLKLALKKHLAFLPRLRQKRIALEKTLGLSAKEKALFKTARLFSHLKALRIDTRHYFCFSMGLWFKQLAKKHSLPHAWFEYANEKEIVSLLKGLLVENQKIINRSNFYSEIWEGKKVTRLSKKAIRKFLARNLVKETSVNQDFVSGQPAFLGKITGKAKIIFNPRDIAKVKKGNILIAVYTDPNLLPAMERAAGFVTDQGGITSHAAITAREMKKPCVIGTKIATKIFKDGDLVEMDANKGIVKKI